MEAVGAADRRDARRPLTIPQTLRDATEHQPAARAALAAALGGAGPRLPVRRARRHRQARGGAGLRRRAAGRGRARPRRRPAPRAGRPLAAPGPGLARAAGHPAPGRRGPRAGDHGGRLPAVRGGAPRVRDRGGGGDGRREPERAPEDARGAARDSSTWCSSPPSPTPLLETVRSRCQAVRFAPLAPEAVEERLDGARAGGSARSAAPRRGLPAATSSGPRFLLARRGPRAARRRRGVRRGRRAPASSPSAPGDGCWPRPRRRRRGRPRRRRERRAAARPTEAGEGGAAAARRALARGRGGRQARRRGARAPRRSTSGWRSIARLASRPRGRRPRAPRTWS